MDSARFMCSQRTAALHENADDEFDVCLNENKNTKRKTETDMRIFLSYLVSIDETREPENISADELDRHLATYFSVIKKHDGNEYEPASLRGMLCSIERYLRTKDYPTSLTRGVEFASTRSMLKERQKILRDLAKTDKASKSDDLVMNTVLRLNQLYLAKEFGPHNPSAVVNALCFALVVHLKIRKASEHKQLLWGDIALKMSAANAEYLCYEPHPGYEYCRLPLKGISGYKVLAQSPETSPWDPVSIYKLYRQRRPGIMMSPDSPLYLGIAVPVHESLQQPWFKPVAMGVNKLNDLVRMIRDITGTLCHCPSYPTDMSESRYPNITGLSNMRSAFRKDENEDTRASEIYPPGGSRFERDNIESTLIVAKSADLDSASGGHTEQTTVSERHNNVPDAAMSIKHSSTDPAGAAIEKIKCVLNTLGSEAKSDVIQWMKGVFVLSGPGEQRHTEKRKRLRLSVELDGAALENNCCVGTLAEIQVVSEAADDNLPSDANGNGLAQDMPTTLSSAQTQDTTNASSNTADENVEQHLYYDQVDSLHKMRQNVFKRALSYPSDVKKSRLQTENDAIVQIPQPPVSVQQPPVSVQQPPVSVQQPPVSVQQPPVFEPVGGERQTSHPANIFNVYSMDSSNVEKRADLVPPIQGYNPYAAWALDPRFAMFMRTGFLQTYQDFVNLYRNPEAKDPSNNC